MRKISTAFAALVLVSVPVAANAHKGDDQAGSDHSGGTDSRGCHTNHKTGDYHCHNRK